MTPRARALDVLRGLTLALQPRKVLALVGRSGGGKTTVVRPSLPPVR